MRLRISTAAWILAGIAGLGVASWAWCRRAPTRAPAESAGLDPDVVLILPFGLEQPSEQTAWLRQGLADLVRTQLGQAPGLRIEPRHRVAAALEASGYEETSRLSTNAASELARSLGAASVVTGTLSLDQGGFVLASVVIDAERARVRQSAVVRGAFPEGLLEGVHDLTLALLHELRLSGAPSLAAPDRPAQLTTRSLQASRLYLAALDRWRSVGGRQGAVEAETFLDQALVADPAFAQAYLKKAEIRQWRRQMGYGDPDPAPSVLAASRLIKDLSDQERLLVESFEALVIKNEKDLALRRWSALLEFYPTYAHESGILGLVATTLMDEGRWDEIIILGQANVGSSSLPDADRAVLAGVMSQACRRKGQMPQALQYARRSLEMWPRREGPEFLRRRTNLGRILLESGLRADALREFRTVAVSRDADVTNLAQAAWGLYMAGLPDEAHQVVQSALVMDPAFGNAHHLLGWLRLAKGDALAAASSFERAVTDTPPDFQGTHQGHVGADLAAFYYAGIAYERAGQPARARDVLGRLSELCTKLLVRLGEGEWSAPRWQAANFLARTAARLGTQAPEPGRLVGDDATYFVQSARLHAVQGRKDLAMAELENGLALGHGEHRHIADDPDFESLRSNPRFRRAVLDALRR